MSGNSNLLLGAASALVLLATAPAVAQNDTNVTIIEEPGPAERAGEAIDDAASETAEAVRGAVRETGEAARDAADAVRQRMETEEAEITIETEGEADVTVVEPGQAGGATPFVEGVIAEQSMETDLASVLMDASVISAAGEDIGHVNNLIIGPDGEIQGLVIGVGGFLGIGEKDVAIRMDSLERTTDGDGEMAFVLNATVEDLEAAPEFRTAEEIRRDAEAARRTGQGVAPADVLENRGDARPAQ